MTIRILCFAVLSLSFACSPGGVDGDAGPGDGGTDGGSDAGTDGGSDAGTDAGSDAGPDGGSNPDGLCRSGSDCGPYDLGSAECAVPDPIAWQPMSVCGACFGDEDECATDADCGTGFVCRPDGPCGCGQSILICVDGCQSDDDCLTGQTCDGESHCVVTTCGVDGDCPSQFTCASWQCERLTCSGDGDCDAGYCVNGLCFDALGGCFENIPVP